MTVRTEMKKFFAVLGKALLFFLSWAIITGLLPIPDSSNGAIWRFWAELIPFLTVVGISLLFWLLERRKIALHIIPSLDKGIHGFDGRKCAHTSSSPLTIRQYSLRVFSRLNTFPLRQNCFAPDSDGFSSDFCFLRCRRAGARQGEKGKKRRKGALSGVSALIKRWYPHRLKTPRSA